MACELPQSSGQISIMIGAGHFVWLEILTAHRLRPSTNRSKSVVKRAPTLSKNEELIPRLVGKLRDEWRTR